MHGSDPVRPSFSVCRRSSKTPKGTIRAPQCGLHVPWAHLLCTALAQPLRSAPPRLSYLVFSSWNLVPHHGMSTYHLSSEARFKYSPFHEIFASQKIFDFSPLHIHNTLCLTSLMTFTSAPYNTGPLSLSPPLPLGITPQMYGPLRRSISAECTMLMEG